MERLEFNYNMTILLNKELEKKGIYRNKSLFSSDFYSFSVEELEQIESLVIENANDLTHIDKFPNLKKVVIQSVEYTRFGEEIKLDSATYANCIEDFSPLENCVGIEELTIVNDTYIESLDVSKFVNLKNIKLINVPKLTNLVGLEHLKNLENVMIYGTSIHSEFDIVEYIKNTFQAETNILDVNMYQSLVKQDEKLAQYISEAVIVGETHLRFAELVGLMDYAIIDAKALEDMYKRVTLLFEMFGIYDEVSEEEKIEFVYKFVTNNTVFDKEGIENRDVEYNTYIEKYNKIPEFAKNKFAMIHSSYNALMLGKSNCEGFVNLIKFMLNILEIRSFNVHCIDVRNNVNNLPNHAMIRILNKGTWYYCDPTIIPGDPYHFFMKTYEEISEEGRHRLNAFERQVNGEIKHEPYNGPDSGKQFRG